MNLTTTIYTVISGAFEELGKPLCRYEIRLNANEAHIVNFEPLYYGYTDEDGSEMIHILLEMLEGRAHTVYFEHANADFIPMLLDCGFDFDMSNLNYMYIVL